MVRFTQMTSIGLTLIATLALSMPIALSNSPPHYFVLPGTCELVAGNNSAVSMTTVGGKPGLTLFSNAPSFPFASAADFIFESTNPAGNPTGFAIPQGTFSFNLLNNTPGVLDIIQVIGYYDNGTVFLLDTGIENAASGQYNINTVRNLGNLRAIGFRYTAEFSGTIIVSNFQNNTRPMGLNGINHNIGCLAIPVVPVRAAGSGWGK